MAPSTDAAVRGATRSSKVRSRYAKNGNDSKSRSERSHLSKASPRVRFRSVFLDIPAPIAVFWLGAASSCGCGEAAGGEGLLVGTGRGS